MSEPEVDAPFLRELAAERASLEQVACGSHAVYASVAKLVQPLYDALAADVKDQCVSFIVHDLTDPEPVKAAQEAEENARAMSVAQQWRKVAELLSYLQTGEAMEFAVMIACIVMPHQKRRGRPAARFSSPRWTIADALERRRLGQPWRNVARTLKVNEAALRRGVLRLSKLLHAGEGQANRRKEGVLTAQRAAQKNN